MDIHALIEKSLSPARPWIVWIAALGVLSGVYAVPRWVEPLINRETRFQSKLSSVLEQTAAAREHRVSLEKLKTTDLEQLKSGLGGHALSEKSLFESGLSLQEERRLLEKQLEIMTTTLLINPALQRVFLMRAEQPLQAYLINYIPMRSFGGALPSLPRTVRIVSKERFAHPERGTSEEVNGTLQWVPPQVGTSVRSKALGEFVMFTNTALILHGPPLNEEDHERFPHICLGLDQEAARRLYRGSYIGTKINLSRVSVESAPTSGVPATPVVPSTGPR